MAAPRNLTRTLGLALLGTFLAASSLPAQEPPPSPSERKFQLFAGFEPAFFYSEVDGFGYAGAAQLGMGYFWSPTISSEISVALRQGDFEDATVVDAAALYHFPSSSRWKLFAGTGVHYAQVQTEVGPILLGGGLSGMPAARADSASTELEQSGVGWLVTGGVNYLFSSRFSLRMDARYVPVTISGDRDSDEDFSSTIGLGLRF